MNGSSISDCCMKLMNGTISGKIQGPAYDLWFAMECVLRSAFNINIKIFSAPNFSLTKCFLHFRNFSNFCETKGVDFLGVELKLKPG